MFTAGAIGGGTYYVLSQQIKKQDKLIEELQNKTEEQNNKTTEQQKDEKKTESQALPEPSNKKYNNNFGKYSLALPNGYVVEEHFQGCEGLCTQEVTVIKNQDNTKSYNMYININVYKDTKISDLQSKMNEPSNENAYNVQDLDVGGVAAKKFDLPGLFGSTKYIFVKGLSNYSITVEEIGAYPESSRDQKIVLAEILKTLELQ